MIFAAADLERWLEKYEFVVDVPLAERLRAHQAAVAELRARRPFRSTRTTHLPTHRSHP